LEPTLAERIYLDHAATTPILPAARAAVAEAMERWANPSSPHAEGRAAHAALEGARARMKQALRWKGELIFTSGASEALAIALGRTDRPVFASAVEHDAVFRAAPDAMVLPMGAKAQVSRDALDAALRSGPPAIFAIQHVNSETGVEQPIESLVAQVRESGGLLVCDCSQSAGKVRLPDADMIAISAHKLGGPPGIGALLVRDLAMLKGVGGQEFGYRPGTQNLPGALGFAAAVEQHKIGVFPDGPPDALPMVRWLSDMGYPILDLESPIGQAGGTYPPEREPGDMPRFRSWIQAIAMRGMSAAAQLIRFDAAGIAVSAGSACSSGSLKPSRVLQAFGVPDADAACTIRVSFGWSTTAEEIQQFLETWLDIASDARSRAA
jgi:cysteine desulfurase